MKYICSTNLGRPPRYIVKILKASCRTIDLTPILEKNHKSINLYYLYVLNAEKNIQKDTYKTGK
jgi:hypothetical protein